MFKSLRQSLSAFNRNVRLYLLTSLLLGLSVDGVYAVLFNLFLLRLGYDPRFIGLINSAGLFTFAFTSLPAGLLGARYGSRRMLMVGVVAVLFGGTLVPLAQSVPATSRWSSAPGRAGRADAPGGRSGSRGRGAGAVRHR